MNANNYLSAVVTYPAPRESILVQCASMFLNLTEAYSLTVTPEGRRYSYLRGHQMITLSLSGNAVISGAEIYRAIRALRRDPHHPQEAIQSAGLPVQPKSAPLLRPSSAAPDTAFVSYISTSELEKMLGMYNLPVKTLILVPATASLIPGCDLQRINSLYDDKPATPLFARPAVTDPSSHIREFEEEPEEYAPVRKKKRSNAPVIICCTLIALALGTAVVWWLRDNFTTDPTYGDVEIVDALEPQELLLLVDSLPSDSVPTVETDSLSATVSPDSIAAAEQSVPADTVTTAVSAEKSGSKHLTAEELADVEYLNASRTWRRDKLKSEMMQHFFDLMLSGNIDAIAESVYFATPGLATNSMAVKIADMLWASKGTPTQISNENVLKRLNGKTEIVLWNVYDAVGRLRPVKPNPTPRPSNI